jgi:hypothetical protein
MRNVHFARHREGTARAGPPALTYLLRLVGGLSIGVAFGLALWALGFFAESRTDESICLPLPSIFDQFLFGMF